MLKSMNITSSIILRHMPYQRTLLDLSTRLVQRGQILSASKFNPVGRRGYAARPDPSPLKVLPILAILAAGTGSYMLMVKSRAKDPQYQKSRGNKLTPE